MKRLPVLPTLIVALAIGAMIGLGVWQLHRAQWKAGLLAQYAAAAHQPPIALPIVPDAKNPPLFRKADAFCLSVVKWTPVAARNLNGDAGWGHVADCRTGAEGPGFAVDMGWSERMDAPAWRGGQVSGTIAADRERIYRLIAATPAPGLQPTAPPNMADIPNNHMAYAVQWFIFAALAAIIYLIALRRRRPTGADGADGPR